MKILYVDDDRDDRNIFREAVKLVSPSIEFDSVSSCEEAIFKLKSQKPPNLIFLDLNMPSRTGIDCLKIIKANPLLRKIPVIIYSTSNDQTQIKECLQAGACEYLIKPNDFKSLCNQLKSRLH